MGKHFTVFFQLKTGITLLMMLSLHLAFGQVASEKSKSNVQSVPNVANDLSLTKNWVSATSTGTAEATKTPKEAIAKRLSVADITRATASFIKNIGQYGQTMKGHEQLGNILFGYEGLDMPVLFTPKGLVYLHRKYEKISHEEEERLERMGVNEEEIERKLIITDRVITMEWVGSNPNAEIITAEKAADYHTYGMLQEKAYGYKKIIYKNMYPGVDLVYSFTDNGQLGFDTAYW